MRWKKAACILFLLCFLLVLTSRNGGVRVSPFLPLLHWRRSSSNLAPMRVPRRHQQIHHYPKHVPRHALPSHSTHIGQGGAELPPLFLLIALGLTILQRHQRHGRQGLTLVHPCLHTGRSHDVAIRCVWNVNFQLKRYGEPWQSLQTC